MQMSEQNQSNQYKKFKNVGQVVLKVGLAAVVANLASKVIIGAAGFTSSGVGAGTFAAGVQSGIGAVKAGSVFAYLQSIGALGQGILGAAALPVIAGVIGIALIASVIYVYRQEITKFIKKCVNCVRQGWEKIQETLKKVPEELNKVAKKIQQESVEIAKKAKKAIRKAIRKAQKWFKQIKSLF